MKRHINAQRGREKLNHAVKALNTINMFAVKLNEAEVATEQGNARPIQIFPVTKVSNIGTSKTSVSQPFLIRGTLPWYWNNLGHT